MAVGDGPSRLGDPAHQRAGIRRRLGIRAGCVARIGRLLGTVRRGRQTNDGKDFSATQASVFLDGFTFRSFVRECCAEHHRRMGEFDPELLQPRFLPRLAAITLIGLRLGTGFHALQEKRA